MSGKISEKMRLDKFLVSTGSVTRSEAIKLCRIGKVTVNGRAEKDSSVKIDPVKDAVSLLGKEIQYRLTVFNGYKLFVIGSYLIDSVAEP